MAGELRVRVDAEEHLDWWRPLAQSVLAAPHLLWTGVLTGASVGLALVSAICVLVSGRQPRLLAAVHALTLRERVRTYSYWFALRASYPPMAWRPALADPGDDPATSVSVSSVPSRFRRRDVFARVVLVPHLVVLLPIAAVMDACYPMWIALAAANRGWPPPFRRFLVAVERWVVAFAAYALFLTDEPPAFGLRAYADAAAEDVAAVDAAFPA